MGELFVGKPVLQLNFQVSLPLDLVSIMSLLYRAVPGSGLDPWLVSTRRALPDEVRADLDLLHGFSGRLLYFMEEPILRFEPLVAEHADAKADEVLAYLDEQPAGAFVEMVVHALQRVHRDLGEARPVPDSADDAAWRRFLEPGLTTASADEVVGLLREPEQLKARTIGLIRGIWQSVYRPEYEAREPLLLEAARLAEPEEGKGFGQAFADLTGSRLPSTLVTGLGEVARVTFCPSAHLGTFVSYILYPPDLVVFFGAPEWLARVGGSSHRQSAREMIEMEDGGAASQLTENDLLEGLRALSDSNRLQILDLLGGGELYAQEIVGRLGIAQSAVSRHLALLERSGLVQVQPRRGMKYYRVAGERLNAIADSIRQRA